MDNQGHIRELREKAFEGDTEALELYNEYVNKEQAPGIIISNKTTNNHMEMYKQENIEKRPSLFGDIDPTKLHEVNRTPYTLMSAGYESRKEEAKNMAGDVTNFAGEKVDRNLSPLEQMSLAYNPNGTQKNQDVTINLNDIKKMEDK
jgi:hypothetical protein